MDVFIVFLTVNPWQQNFGSPGRGYSHFRFQVCHLLCIIMDPCAVHIPFPQGLSLMDIEWIYITPFGEGI